MKFVTSDTSGTCVKHFWAWVKFFRITAEKFSMFGQKCRESVKKLKNSMTYVRRVAKCGRAKGFNLFHVHQITLGKQTIRPAPCNVAIQFSDGMR